MTPPPTNPPRRMPAEAITWDSAHQDHRRPSQREHGSHH